VKFIKSILLLQFLVSFNLHAVTLDIFKQMLKCQDMKNLKGDKKNDKFFSCLEPYIHYQENKLVKQQIALTFFQMEKITSPAECSKKMKKTLQSVYKNGSRFVCFKAMVDGQEKESFAVFQKSDKEKLWKNWKIIRLKYH